jgi:serine/threonine-protein kinase
LLAAAYAAAGRRAEALAILRAVERNPAPLDLLTLAMVRFDLGDDDRGFEWLERAVAARHSYVRWLNVHPAFDPWRNDPRFVALVRRLHLPAAP